jgi:hypothetical protein
MEEKKKRKQFSLDEKKKILEEIDRGMKKGDVARKYGISPSALSTFLKDRDKIEKSIHSDTIGPQRKKIRTANNEDVDKAVYRWVLDTRSKNIPVNGPLLCERAQSFARSFGVAEFKGSAGWLHRFREWHPP